MATKIQLLAESYLSTLAKYSPKRAESIQAVLIKDGVTDEEIIQAFQTASKLRPPEVTLFPSEQAAKFDECCNRFLVEAKWLQGLAAMIGKREADRLAAENAIQHNFEQAMIQLPDEILLSILRFFNNEELREVAKVSQRFRNLAQDPSLKTPLLDYKQNAKVTSKRIDGISVMVGLPNENTVTGHEDGTISIWDSKLDKRLHVLKAHPGKITAIAVLRNGNIVSGSLADSTLRIWNSNTVECLNTLNDVGLVYGLKVLPNGNIISHSGEEFRIWDLKTGKQVNALKNVSASDKFDVLPNGNIVIGSEWYVLIWDTSKHNQGKQDLKCVGKHSGLIGKISDILALPNGNIVSCAILSFSTSKRNQLLISNSKTGECLIIHDEWELEDISKMAFLPNGDIITGSDHPLGTIRIWDLSEKKPSKILNFAQSFNIVISAKGNIICHADGINGIEVDIYSYPPLVSEAKEAKAVPPTPVPKA